MNSLKRITALLIMALLLIVCTAAQAETNTWDVERADLNVFWRATTFEEDMPGEVRKALDGKGFKEYQGVCGALLETLPKGKKANMAETNATALVAVEKDSRRVLVGISRSGNTPWSVVSLGEGALIKGREFEITLRGIGSESVRELNTRFCVVYQGANGGTESYGFWVGWAGLWYMKTYEALDAKGEGTCILAEYPDYGFRMVTLPTEDVRAGTFYAAYVPLWAEYMNIADFPTTEAQAKSVAEASWKRFEGTDLAMAYGDVNLRESPTSESRSLFKFNSGALVHVLGQEKGKYQPWYHVRVGQAEGWVSGVYLKFPKNEDIVEAMWHLPLPVARTKKDIALSDRPDRNGQSLAKLPEGTLLHVIAVVDRNWLYVMAPQGEISWEMDVDGVGGYIRADQVAEGASVNAVTK